MTDLRLFDLNLLVAFDALMAERNVTRAARRVSLGQPAMSHALSRLRELFGDPLFIRTAEAMRPTTRALELAPSIGRVLAEIRESVLKDRAFAPEQAEITFRVGASDHIELAILPAVLAALRSAAPKARIAVTSVDRDRLGAMLESGAIDLAIGYFPDPSSALTTELLFHEDLVCLFDAEACGVSAPLTLEAYLDLPHIVMSLRGELNGVVDRLIERAGRKRFVLMATPHFLAIPFLLHGFRAAAAVPRRLAENCRDVAGLSMSPLPVAVDGFDVSMQWHARTETDPAQIWFRELVRASGRSEPRTSRRRKGKR
ncbi:transcriptional regulator, LysR family [Rhizobiales bacterium GAS191]|jgi:LysR family transcriptional activator of mexEF-oprN operon|nr:transcriptional regulator, LysR family [Rhizobiales bacterium GAS188]SEE36594.1 transcriptional regulator, LysR family [Rhizobiales bacterium GAS191]